ncbi:helix-turn-helix domain-containing protein [Desulfosediminicola flagellatus]|uniref:helix-turn-helix domain-containing protein n=1 Tax=Desulfosediminicola flagellatus TaxID=2569541 RepID=UPI0010AB5C7B|nr:helix-turn-helix transcriptional regulator [Desulfosediminicola flagellatus]
MTTEPHETEPESLGQFLRKTRIELGFDLEQICEETKISASNLKAIEGDSYGSLPADAFARGFYSLYARALKLNSDEIVKRFLTERGSLQRKNSLTSHNPPAHKAAQEISNMAEPSGASPMSTIGLALLLLILLTGGVCWYFDINPATFISEKIRSIEQNNTQDTAPSDPDNSSIQAPEPENAGDTSTFNRLQTMPDSLLAGKLQQEINYLLLPSSYSYTKSVAHLQG